MQVLLIQGSRNSVSWLDAALQESDFQIFALPTVEHALRTSDSSAVHAIILELGDSAEAETRAIRNLRSGEYNQPLIVLSEWANWRERVDCLDAGADDYIVKPVRSEEVAARLRAIIRRSAGVASDCLTAGEISLDLKGRVATLRGQNLSLSRNEFRLLQALMLKGGKPLSHAEIHELLYAREPERTLNAIEVHVARLRRKIGREHIVTVRGIGYGMACNANALF